MNNNESINSKNLKAVTNQLETLDYFIFFGTLLSFMRNDQLINRDDDIDIMVNINDKIKLLELLENSKLELKVNTDSFCQYFSIDDIEQKFPIDFYFFIDDHKKIIDKWNFFGWEGKKFKRRHEMHLDKKLIFPLKSIKFLDSEVKVPNNPTQICKYLYGPRWNTPLSKNVDYFIFIFNNKPVIFYNKQIVKLLYILSLFLNKKYSKGLRNLYYLIPKKIRKIIKKLM